MVAWSIIATLLLVFLILLVLRLIFEWVFVLARGFRPTGPLVLLLEVIYSSTDPPIKALRRVIPPIRVGQMSFDLGFVVALFVVGILYQFARSHAS